MLGNRSLLEVRRQARKKVFKPDAGSHGCKCKRPLSSLLLPARSWESLEQVGWGWPRELFSEGGTESEETLAPTGPAWLQSLALALPTVALDKLFVFSEARTAGSDGYTYAGPCAD